MARVSIRLNQRGIAHVTNERLMRIARQVANSSARKVNVDTGYLRSTRSVQNLGKTARVAYRASYAKAVHDGSRPHLITAGPGHFLKFAGRGGTTYARTVNHPGYRGNPYLTGALREVLARYSRAARG